MATSDSTVLYVNVRLCKLFMFNSKLYLLLVETSPEHYHTAVNSQIFIDDILKHLPALKPN